jgi:hypothetical protein
MNTSSVIAKDWKHLEDKKKNLFLKLKLGEYIPTL